MEAESAIPADRVHYAHSVHLTDAGSRALAEVVGRELLASPHISRILASGTADAAGAGGSIPRSTTSEPASSNGDRHRGAAPNEHVGGAGGNGKASPR